MLGRQRCSRRRSQLARAQPRRACRSYRCVPARDPSPAIHWRTAPRGRVEVKARDGRTLCFGAGQTGNTPCPPRAELQRAARKSARPAVGQEQAGPRFPLLCTIGKIYLSRLRLAGSQADVEFLHRHLTTIAGVERIRTDRGRCHHGCASVECRPGAHLRLECEPRFRIELDPLLSDLKSALPATVCAKSQNRFSSATRLTPASNFARTSVLSVCTTIMGSSD